ncbi:hypothetical protein SVAN01_00748 [Stagonosporopsis vannaccii]|nr:hypothetical protein SVAN01_00748 [Stagonosporopsis vannaccii]
MNITSSKIARFILIGHGLLNIAQGIYSIIRTQDWVIIAGSGFTGSPPAAVQAIAGLGALGIGWYQFVFACQNNQPLLAVTVPLRLVYASILAWSGNNGKVVAYELVVCGLAAFAAWPNLAGRLERGTTV